MELTIKNDSDWKKAIILSSALWLFLSCAYPNNKTDNGTNNDSVQIQDSSLIKPYHQCVFYLDDSYLELERQDSAIHVVADTMPQFPGGNIACSEFLKKHVHCPVKNKTTEKVFVAFVVERNGSISNVSAVDREKTSFTMEAERVIKMMPKWSPGISNGDTVRTRIILPVIFECSKSNSSD